MPGLSRRKKAAFALVTTLLFFAGLEGTLALLGIHPASDLSDPYVGFAGSSSLFIPDTTSNDAPHMVTAPGKLAWFNSQQFSVHKASGTRRVFCLGGSTTYGRPYDDSTSFAGWLRELLPRVAPQTEWEVINAGGVSYASYRVARLVEELVEYEPDLFIVYTGHNEFLEERTYGELKAATPLDHGLNSIVSQTRTAALVRRLFIDPHQRTPGNRFQLADDVDTILDKTVGPTSYQRDVHQRQQIIEHFEFNLSRIVAISQQAGVPVVLITPASNIQDCSPFKSQHADQFVGESLESWTQLYERARLLERNGDSEQALLEYDRLITFDPEFAESHWRRGRLLLKSDRPTEADKAFALAVDHDVCPLRAISVIPQIVRRVASELDVPLVDFEQLIALDCQEQTGHASPGQEYFLDHVHPTVSTHGTLALAIVQRLVASDFVRARNEPNRALLNDVAAVVESRIDARKHAIALRNLAKVLNWAGKHLEAGSLAMRAVEQLPDDPESLVLSAAYLAQTGRVEQAINNYRRAIRFRPDYATAHQMLAAALVDQGELDDAVQHFSELARLRPDDAQAWQMIGAIHAEQGQFEESLQYYNTAMTLNSDDSNLHYNIANALNHLGRSAESIAHYTRAVELNPDDADARNNLGVMLMQDGRPSEAAEQFREVLRLRPNDRIATDNLRDCLPAAETDRN